MKEMQRRIKLAKTPQGQILVAIWTDWGFSYYNKFKDSQYYRNQIRKIAQINYGVLLPREIDWENLPVVIRFEKWDTEKDLRAIT